VLGSVAPEGGEGSDERSIRFLIYGNVDAREYAYVYELVYDKAADRVSRARVTDLEGDGFETDYTTGEVFQFQASANSQTTKAASFSCLLDNLASCSTAVQALICAGTAGVGCLTNVLQSALLDVACGITFSCQPVTPFTLAANPSSRIIQQGGSTTYTISANFKSGFSGPVISFGVSGLPSGAWHSFSQSGIYSSGNSTNLTVYTSSGTPTGVRTLTVSATGGGKTVTLPVSLNVQTGQGSIEVKATLNGVPWSGNLYYALTLFSGGSSVPRTHTGAYAGAYMLTYLWGGPSNATLSGISPASSQTLATGGTITFTLNFVSSGGGSPSSSTLTGSVSNGQWWTSSVTVPSGRSKLKVSLSWSGGGDLDLHLTSPSGTKYGYSENTTGYSGFWTNPETIELTNPQSGPWQVRVLGWSVSSGPRSFTVNVTTQ